MIHTYHRIPIQGLAIMWSSCYYKCVVKVVLFTFLEGGTGLSAKLDVCPTEFHVSYTTVVCRNSDRNIYRSVAAYIWAMTLNNCPLFWMLLLICSYTHRYNTHKGKTKVVHDDTVSSGASIVTFEWCRLPALARVGSAWQIRD